MKQFKDKNNKLCHIVFNIEKDIDGEVDWISNDEDYLQTAIWKYKKNTHLQEHIHIRNERTIKRTHEMIIVFKGIIVADLYDYDKNLLDTVNLRDYDVLYTYYGGHSFDIISDDSLAMEIKNGPFISIEADKVKF